VQTRYTARGALEARQPALHEARQDGDRHDDVELLTSLYDLTRRRMNPADSEVQDKS
jgi:hypothetical protein